MTKTTTKLRQVMPSPGAKIMVALSGGVDSAVTAALLQAQNYDITGVFMRNWEDDDGTEECTSMQDWLDAQKVCAELGIELLQVNFSKDYKDKVFLPFLNLLKQGYTPNPDIMCNSVIKFARLRDFALEKGAEFLATGHYAKLLQDESDAGKVSLHQAADRNKCQTYFLYRVTNFSNSIMPLGDMQKDEVRAYAQKIGLHNHRKKDSTGLCFIGERNFSDFISRYLDDEPGDIVDAEGKVWGKHRGLFHYTLGQRQGLGIGGVKELSGEPWFVVSKDRQKNYLIVSQGKQAPQLFSKELTAGGLTWVGDTAPSFPLDCKAKIRYRSEAVPCEVSLIAGNGNGNGNGKSNGTSKGPAGDTDSTLHVVFKDEQRSITPGQSVVLYADERCLGGGIIR